MFTPANLHEAYCLAKLQEATLASITRRTKPILEKHPALSRNWGSSRGSMGGSNNTTYSRPFGRGGTIRGPSQSGSTASSTGSVSSNPRRSLTPREIDEKRANNLCFFCDEKYFPGHKCSSQVYRLEIVEGEEGEEEQEGLEKETVSIEEVDA